MSLAGGGSSSRAASPRPVPASADGGEGGGAAKAPPPTSYKTKVKWTFLAFQRSDRDSPKRVLSLEELDDQHVKGEEMTDTLMSQREEMVWTEAAAQGSHLQDDFMWADVEERETQKEAEAFLTDSVTIYEESVQQGDPDMAEMFGQPAHDKAPKRAVVVDRAAPDTASGAGTSKAGGAPPSGGTKGDFDQEALDSEDDFQMEPPKRGVVAGRKDPPLKLQLDELAGLHMCSNAESQDGDEELKTATTQATGRNITFGQIFMNQAVADAVVRGWHSPMCLVRASLLNNQPSPAPPPPKTNPTTPSPIRCRGLAVPRSGHAARSTPRSKGASYTARRKSRRRTMAHQLTAAGHNGSSMQRGARAPCRCPVHRPFHRTRTTFMHFFTHAIPGAASSGRCLARHRAPAHDWLGQRGQRARSYHRPELILAAGGRHAVPEGLCGDHDGAALLQGEGSSHA